MRNAFSLIVLGVFSVCACSSSEKPSANPLTDASHEDANVGDAILELDVTNDPKHQNGQPKLVVNPKDPNNLVIVATNHDITMDGGLLAPTAWGCWVGYSTDRGRTWTRAAFSYGGANGCGEPNVAVDSDGTFYVLFNELHGMPGDDTTAIEYADMHTMHAAVSRSADGGKTWSDPVPTPLQIGGEPKLRVDPKTGKIYALAGLNHYLNPSGISVSSDHGLTWGPPVSIGGSTANCTMNSFGISTCGGYNQIAVYDGILVAGSEASLEVSRDDGESWTEFPITNSSGTQIQPAAPTPASTTDPGGGKDPTPWISADPTHSGRFAAMMPRSPNMEVYVTEDAGQTWNGPAVIAAPDAVRPWMDFGSTGVLGVMWRTTAVDAYSAVSLDGGHTFSPPLRVNQVTQPASNSGPPGDDWSSITADDQYAFVTWSDGRTCGMIDGILARVPLSLYGPDGGGSRWIAGTRTDMMCPTPSADAGSCMGTKDCSSGQICCGVVSSNLSAGNYINKVCQAAPCPVLPLIDASFEFCTTAADCGDSGDTCASLPGGFVTGTICTPEGGISFSGILSSFGLSDSGADATKD